MRKCAPRHMAIVMALLLSACDTVRQGSDSIVGDTPSEVSTSIVRLRAGLDPDKETAFSDAINTLKLTVPDKNDSASIGYISPQFARMISGRNVDQIIQMAVLYRSSAPPDRL